jgi:hypothetical protein
MVLDLAAQIHQDWYNQRDFDLPDQLSKIQDQFGVSFDAAQKIMDGTASPSEIASVRWSKNREA